MRIAYGPVVGWSFDGRDGVLISIDIDSAGVVLNVELEDGEHAGFMLDAAAVDARVLALARRADDERSVA